MSLPRRLQPFAKFVRAHNLTYDEVAEQIGLTRSEVNNLAQGNRYPSPREIDAILALFDHAQPIETLFDAELLKYKDAKNWPPVGRGFRPGRVEEAR